MSQILNKTHKKDNVDLLKKRDYFFEKARIGQRWFTSTLIIPPILTISYIILGELYPSFDGDVSEFIIGFLTIILFIIGIIIEKKINQFKNESNAYRDEYDELVLGIKDDIFINHDFKLKINKKKLAYSKLFNNRKYKVWYGELFSKNEYANTISCQMDNIIYTEYLYRDLKTYYYIIIGGSVFITTAISIYIISQLNLVLLIWFSFMSIIFEFLDRIGKVNETLDNLDGIFCTVIEQKDTISSDFPFYIRNLQTAIYHARQNTLFSPRFIRNKHLKADSAYFEKLNKVRHTYLSESVEFPQSAKEIEVQSTDGHENITLDIIQHDLLEMLKIIVEIFNRYQIPYVIEGGTLIGAIREKGKMLFWDDDIDLAIPHTYIEQATTILKENLPLEFKVQDFSELFYSPRLSNIRVRNTNSIVDERDSILFDRYENRGLFIDIYAYQPVLKNILLDKLMRLFLSLFNYNLEKKELAIGPYENEASNFHIKKYKYFKNIQLFLINLYMKAGKSETYMSYTPNFILNRKKPGPYIPIDYLDFNSSHQHKIMFEGIEVNIPKNPHVVLKSIYGKDYMQNPHISADKLREIYGNENWYNKVNTTTDLDHILYYKKRKKE